MKSFTTHTKRLIRPTLMILRLTTLLALVSYSSIHPPSSALADRMISSPPARQTILDTTTLSAVSASSLKPDRSTQMQLRQDYSKMPIYFIENRGQVDSRVAYYVQGSDKALYFTSEGITFVLTNKIDRKVDLEVPQSHLLPVSLLTDAVAEQPMQQWALKLDFVDAKRGIRPIAQDQTSAIVSYFKGKQDQWQTGLKTYTSLVYPDLWPGIDLVYTGTVNRLKYTFLVKAGADPNQIRLAYRGATDVRLNADGQLEVSTPAGGFNDDKPYSFQEVGASRVEVATSYALEVETSNGAQEYGFRVGEYDRSKPLVLDPAALVYSGFIGGAQDDQGNGIVIDLSGLDENVFIAGTTNSLQTTFPDGDGFGMLPGPDQTFGGDTDAFVAKLDMNGKLVYAGYIGGFGRDEGKAVAVDHISGEAYVVGFTQEDSADRDRSFPHSPPGPDPTYNLGGDGFVVKVNQGGTGLVFASFIGGVGVDQASGVATDADGNAYITGFTTSNESTFPTGDGFDSIPGLDQTFGSTFMTFADAFVVEVFFDGSSFAYATYIGDKFEEEGRGIAVDSDGNAYVIGFTTSSGFHEPIYPPPSPNLQPHNGGGATEGFGDAFVIKLDNTGEHALYLAFIGGNNFDSGNGIAVDNANPADRGNAYITGTTFSSPSDGFPAIKGPSVDYKGAGDAFVGRLLPDGQHLDYAGYIGGSRTEDGRGIAVDADGRAYVTGLTLSSVADGFPAINGLIINGIDRDNQGNGDAFVAKVRADGLGFVYATFLGGSLTDEGNAIAVTVSGKAFVTGSTFSSDFPAKPPVSDHPEIGPDLSFNGSKDAFVSKIVDVARPNPSVSLTCPAAFAIAVAPRGQSSAVVTYPRPFATGPPDVTVTCSPPSGSSFPVGTTTVTCTASSLLGGSATCNFKVIVVNGK